MQGVNYPVLGISDQGDTQMMYPEQNYQFKGNKVTEYPMMQNGGTVKPRVYTNYNKYLEAKKAYGDSLNAYNSPYIALEALKQWQKNPTKKNESKYIDLRSANGDWGADIKHSQPNSNYWYAKNARGFNDTIKWTDENTPDGNRDFLSYYKKPVQPVVYQPATIEQIKPLYQAPQLTMPEKLELSMNKPNVVQSAEGPTFKQGRNFMRESGVNKDTQNFNRLPGFYEEGGTLQENTNMEYGKGGYTVKRSSDRKGKTHVVIGPDGTKKYFGDPNLGERGKSKYGKDAFYARHKKNLDANPYFRAYARATWEEGGMIPEQGHISMNKRSLFKYGGLTVTDLNKYQDAGVVKPSSTGANVSAGIGIANAAMPMIEELIPDKRYTDSEGNDLGSRKSVGESALGSAAQGAMLGANPALAAATGGLSIVAGAVIGGGYGAIKGSMEKDKMDKLQEEAETRINNKNINKRANASYNWGMPNINTSQEMQFVQGGMVLDYNDPNANAELELQETFQMPNGQVGMVDGPSHENGGIAVDLPEGTRIWSDKLKYGGKTFAKHTKPITSKITRLEKEIEEAPINSEAKRNSVMLLNKQLDHYFDVQETNKEANEMKRTFKNGGMIKRADGSYSKRGLWDNIRANKGSGKKPTPEMLEQERKIKAKMEMGGYMYGKGGTNNPGFRALPEEVQQNILANMAMGGQMYGMGGSLNMYQDGDMVGNPNRVAIGAMNPRTNKPYSETEVARYYNSKDMLDMLNSTAAKLGDFRENNYGGINNKNQISQGSFNNGIVPNQAPSRVFSPKVDYAQKTLTPTSLKDRVNFIPPANPMVYNPNYVEPAVF